MTAVLPSSPSSRSPRWPALPVGATPAEGAAARPPTLIPVAASDDACEVDATELEAGTHEFEVTNSGSKVTEFYVYAEGDRVMAEVENIAPGLSRELLVELPAGEYETACKPGMIGDGIRNALTVTGEAATLSEDEALAQAADGLPALRAEPDRCADRADRPPSSTR